jgi:hypothetical protein
VFKRDEAQVGVFGAAFEHHALGAIAAAVIDDDDFNGPRWKTRQHCIQKVRQARFFVEGGDHDGKLGLRHAGILVSCPMKS